MTRSTKVFATITAACAIGAGAGATVATDSHATGNSVTYVRRTTWLGAGQTGAADAFCFAPGTQLENGGSYDVSDGMQVLTNAYWINGWHVKAINHSWQPGYITVVITCSQ